MFDYLVVGAGFAGTVMAERLAADAGKQGPPGRQAARISAATRTTTTTSAGILVHKLRPAHLSHQLARRVRVPVALHRLAAVPASRAGLRSTASCFRIPINLDTINRLYGLSTDRVRAGALLRLGGRAARRRCERPRTWSSARSAASCTTSSFATTRASSGGSIRRSSTPASPRGCRSAPTATTATSRTLIRRCRSTATPGCSSGCSTHPNIKVMLNTDYREIVKAIPFREMIYTGPIDEFFDYRFGKLPYRSLEFRFETFDRRGLQPCAGHQLSRTSIRYTRVHRVQVPDRAGAPEDQRGLRISEGGGRPLLPGAAPGERGALPQLPGAGGTHPGRAFLSAGWRPTSYYNMDQVVAQALTLYTRLMGEQVRNRNRAVCMTTPAADATQGAGSAALRAARRRRDRLDRNLRPPPIVEEAVRLLVGVGELGVAEPAQQTDRVDGGHQPGVHRPPARWLSWRGRIPTRSGRRRQRHAAALGQDDRGGPSAGCLRAPAAARPAARG